MSVSVYLFNYFPAFRAVLMTVSVYVDLSV